MDLTFDKGNPSAPRGHALLYFRQRGDPDQVWATYVMVLPVSMDVAKYVPPFLMGQMGAVSPRDLSAFAFPPAPEKVDGYEFLDALAELRDDDLLFGGEIDPQDVPGAMMAVGQVVQAYAELYAEAAEFAHMEGPHREEAEAEEGAPVAEVVYSLMSDGDRLNELTRLVGKLRFAAEGREEALLRETEEEIYILARYLPQGHQINRLVEAAKSRQGARLADLYLQRCFYLVREEYGKLAQLEREIQELEARGHASQ